MNKRYQVFVRSTYADLREERQEVIQALLIRKVIDDCDYYIVIIAGRYCSLGPNGKSYTQMEYEYAVEQGKPVIAFLHESPGQISADLKTCKPWSSQKELGSVVSRSIVKQIKA